jgi:soluble lytic murein transglycosylase-like protein
MAQCCKWNKRGKSEVMNSIMLSLIAGCMTVLLVRPADASDIFVGADDEEVVVLSNVPFGDDYLILIKGQDDQANLAGSLAAGDAVGQGTTRGREKRVVLDRAVRYAPLVDAAAREAKIDPSLLHAVIATESAYNPAARSHKGAIGLTQLMPDTARRYGVADAYDPRQSILGGARYLADLMTLFDQDVRLALAAYNAGERAVLRYGRRIPPYRETNAYVPRVLDYYRAFSRTSF